MRNPVALLGIAMVWSMVGVSTTRAQCPTVDSVSPTIIGRTTNPATTRFNLNGDVAKGDTIVINSSSATPLAFEFTTDGNVTSGRIPVLIPSETGNRDAARNAFIDAVNNEPSSPCEASSIYANEFPQYLTLVWKGDGGYGATNSNPVNQNGNIQVRTFEHAGNARSYLLLTGTNLNTATAVKLQSTTSSDVLNGTWEYTSPDYTKRGFRVTAVPDTTSSTPAAPAPGDYNVVITFPSCTVTLPAAVTLVENLLNDSTFAMHFLGNTNYDDTNCGGAGTLDVWPGPLWKHNGVSGQPVSSFEYREKASYLWDSICTRQDPWPVKDYIWGSLSSNKVGRHQVWQEIPVNFSTQTFLTLKGMYSGGTDDWVKLTYGAELYDQNGTLIAQDGPHTDSTRIDRTPPNTRWADFSVTGSFPAGTTKVKVVFYLTIGTDQKAGVLNFDDLLLYEGTGCPNAPGVSSISPEYGVRGTSQDVTINGTNFINGTTTVMLFQGSNELLPTGVSVVSDTQILATFDLANVQRDYWSVAVKNTGCPAATLPDAFNVVLAGPGLHNGSFELPVPDPPSNNCSVDTDVAGDIDDWTSIHVAPYGGGGHFRDALYSNKFMPKCPPPNGIHWASVQAPDGSYGGMRRLTQTLTVTPGAAYTLSGFFAAGGPNNLSISLLDGGLLDEQITDAHTTVLPGPGDYNWTFGYVTGTPSGDLITAVWDTDNDATGKKIGHADDLVLQECTAAVTVTAVSPTAAASGGTVSGISITGSGFSSGTPVVYLVRPGTTADATNVAVQDDGHLTCDFDLTNAGAGPMDVIVGNNGCYATLADGIFVAAGSLVNGEFEEPFAAQDCGAPPIPVAGQPTGWSVSDLTKFRRDGDVYYPPCPNPDTAGGHYATLSTSEGDNVRIWQVLRVTAGRSYRFGGWFAGGGTNTVSLKLVDGSDPAGTVLKSTTVMTAAGTQYDWFSASVQAQSASELMTVVWEMTDTSGTAASHADGLFVDSPCNNPFADVDQDGDVDQADFAVFQACYTGSEGREIPADPPYCSCLDVEGPLGGPDGDIDQGDLSRFEDCASGPGIPADPTCDD